MSVGTSDRTIGKHVLLNKILGREVGSMAYRPKFIKNHFTIIDMCAGDGRQSNASNTSSPEIIFKHKKFLEKKNIPHDVFLFEKNENTFAMLKKKYPIAELRDSSNLDSLPNHPNNRSACFIHADPNLITDWPISKKLLNNSTDFTTILITLGCNVGGLKRLKIEDRQTWFDKMDDLLDFLPDHHDALLIALRGDTSQWAYLVTGPKVWHDRGLYERDALKAFSYWNQGIDVIRFRKNINSFYEIRDKLFLTKKELACR